MCRNFFVQALGRVGLPQLVESGTHDFKVWNATLETIALDSSHDLHRSHGFFHVLESVCVHDGVVKLALWILAR